MDTCCYQLPFGLLRLAGGPAGLRRIELLEKRPRGCGPAAPASLCAAVAALDDWAAGRAPDLAGVRLDWSQATCFQRLVWSRLIDVGFGCVISYSGLAGLCGRPRAARAVARAMATNPIPVLVPCHRVIRADGALGGFGSGPAWKRRLLEHEGVPVVERRPAVLCVSDFHEEQTP